MDDLDKAQDHMEREEAMRRKYTNTNYLEAEPVKACLNCGEPLAEGLRWCDKDCQTDWEKRGKR